ncbi:MAG: aldehyde dehydrogenase family protein [Rhodopirellula sp.]|nr:aldehyde dehydrogenase family protein [Rhodopirellula sp.]
MRCVCGVEDHLKQGRDEFAKLATLETGKPIVQAKAELDKGIWLCNFYANNAAEYLPQF